MGIQYRVRLFGNGDIIDCILKMAEVLLRVRNALKDKNRKINEQFRRIWTRDHWRVGTCVRGGKLHGTGLPILVRLVPTSEAGRRIPCSGPRKYQLQPY